MKRIILIILMSSVFAFGSMKLCQTYNEKMNQEFEGIKMSIEDKDIIGVRGSCIGFRMYSKYTIQYCSNLDLTALKKARRTILDNCDKFN